MRLEIKFKVNKRDSMFIREMKVCNLRAVTSTFLSELETNFGVISQLEHELSYFGKRVENVTLRFTKS